jgi:hypothetical protein
MHLPCRKPLKRSKRILSRETESALENLKRYIQARKMKFRKRLSGL